MNDLDVDHDDDSIFALASYEPAAPTSRAFQPWHRPRKQFVRRRQWLYHTRDLLSGWPADAELRYLGLPGHDLLDIRLFYEAFCSDRAIRFLGFDAGGGHPGHAPDLLVSLQEVKALGNVHPLSTVVQDDVRTLANKKSMGWKSAVAAGSFDIVNLDFCDNVLSDEPRGYSAYDAVVSLLALQNQRTAPWLLFLTTRADRSTVDSAVRQALDAVLAANLTCCAPFAEEFQTRLVVAGHADENSYVTTCHESDWLHVFCVALCKWILKQAMACNMRLDVKSTMSYRVATDSADDDLVSLALLFTPSLLPLPDHAGLASTGRSLDECTLAARIPVQTAKRRKVDEILRSDDALAQEMREEMGALLAKARYSVSDYELWLAGAV